MNRKFKKHNIPKKCIVHGCENKTDQGFFVKNLICVACFEMLSTGKITPYGNTFIHQLNKNLIEIRNDYINLKYDKEYIARRILTEMKQH